METPKISKHKYKKRQKYNKLKMAAELITVAC